MTSTIKSIENISDIIRQVSERMDEPGLKNKKIEFKVASDREFERYLRKFGIGEAAAHATGTTTVIPGPEDRYVVTLREAGFSTFFPSYFHELGHVANHNLMSRINLAPEKAAIFSEALAYSFEHYAKEKFNDLRLQMTFIDVLAHHLRKEYLKKEIRTSAQSETHRKSMAVIYALLDHNCRTYEETYKTLKGAISKK